MDERLAAIYHTNEESQEKTAASELAEKLAADDGIDLGDLTPEQAEELAQQVVGGDETPAEDETPPEEGAEGEKTAEAEFQEKFAEADFMGRVMAHSLWQELGGIRKEAAFDPEDMKKVPFKYKARGAVRQAGKAIAGAAGKAGGAVAGAAKRVGGAAAGAGKAVGGAVAGAAKAHPKKFMAAGAAGAAGAGFLAGRKSKKSSGTPAFDALVERRVEEIRTEVAPEQTKQSADEVDPMDRLAAAVEQAAVNRLVEAGEIELVEAEPEAGQAQE